VNGYRVN